MQELAYEYKDVTMTSKDASYRLNAYKRFGWETIDAWMDDTPTVRLQRPLDSPQYDTWVNEEQDFEQAMERAQRGHVVLSFSWLKPLKR
jgi:hypothetical protein